MNQQIKRHRAARSGCSKRLGSGATTARQRGTNSFKGSRQREDHDQSGLRGPRPDRSVGSGGLLIRTAIRNQLQKHAEIVNASTARKGFDLGLRHYTREHLETLQRVGEVIEINVLGLATIAADVPPELARATIRSVTVLGALQASPEVKAALADKIR
jgi:Ribbon-Helix-Helix transcriptional regulator family